MRKFPAIAALVFLFAAVSFSAFAQEPPSWEMWALNQIVPGTPATGVVDVIGNMMTGTNGVCIRYNGAVLTADSVAVNRDTGEAVADGHVRITQGEEIWAGEHITYNFKTHLMTSDQFRTGRPPVFAQGENLMGNLTNKTYSAQHVYVTTDDVTDPAIRVRASRIKIVPGKYMEMWNAVLFLKGVPAFYFPYYERNLGAHANNFNFLPGYRSTYGAFLLGDYTWYLDDAADGKIHLDYRTARGVGAGPDLDLKLGQWGDASFKYYYTHDQRPDSGTNGLPNFGPVPNNRERVYFGWQATPFTNLDLKALVNYQSDPFLLHDFFEGEYRDDLQPRTFFEADKHSDNWSLDAMAAPELNSFFDQVERLPDVKFTGFRQQIFNTPLYYDSESSIGYYRKFFANTNNSLTPTLPAYSATRADTFHQILLPWTFFNWLNVTPRAGGRLTYYSAASGPGATTAETYRGVFNTGAEISFKASRLWTDATNSLFQMDGLRHIVEPSVNYVFIPHPSTAPAQLPQFDSQLPALMILPVDFPDYNDIDSITSQNTIRFGLRNTLQTMREGQLDNLLDWNLMLDWNLANGTNGVFLQPQKRLDDLYSDLAFRPRTWITFDSQTRYSIENGNFNLAFNQITFTPNEKWSWGIGHLFLKNGFVDNGDSIITSTAFYRINENWGLRATHDFNTETGRLQEQFYTIYRDMRSWTGALTFRVSNNTGQPSDFTVAFVISLKANPRFGVGGDAVSPYHLLGQ
jgi:LPS-assembly protein